MRFCSFPTCTEICRCTLRERQFVCVRISFQMTYTRALTQHFFSVHFSPSCTFKQQRNETGFMYAYSIVEHCTLKGDALISRHVLETVDSLSLISILLSFFPFSLLINLGLLSSRFHSKYGEFLEFQPICHTLSPWQAKKVRRCVLK